MMIIIQMRAISISRILSSSIAGSPTAALFSPETGFRVYTQHTEPTGDNAHTHDVFPAGMINRARFNNLVDFETRFQGCTWAPRRLSPFPPFPPRRRKLIEIQVAPISRWRSLARYFVVCSALFIVNRDYVRRMSLSPLPLSPPPLLPADRGRISYRVKW
jgi:hypothetical protein